MSIILDEIFANQDIAYRDFHSRLVPNVKNLIGLRGPIAKKIAKKYDATYISNYHLFKKNTDLIPNPTDIHPNVIGYQKIAEEVLDIINNKNK